MSKFKKKSFKKEPKVKQKELMVIGHSITLKPRPKHTKNCKKNNIIENDNKDKESLNYSSSKKTLSNESELFLSFKLERSNSSPI